MTTPATKKKVILITGCSSLNGGGIGSACSIAYSTQTNTIVYSTARTLSSLSALPSTIQKLELDVTSLSSCKKVIDHIIEKEGRIDVLLNNAGAAGTGALVDFEVDGARDVFDVNLFGVMRMTQLVVPHMAKQKDGIIINIGSIVGNIPTPWAGVYASSKAALHSYSEVLRMEVKGLGIKVLLVAPGAITSGFGKKQLNSFHQPDDSLYKSVVASIIARAEISQRPDHTLPASVLAQGIVQRTLQPGYWGVPSVYSAGGKASLFWWLGFVPRWIVWSIFSRMLGTNQVGKK